jgi:uncharacterized linocin/CFP29 family protein
MRDRSPVTDDAWAQIDAEATRTLKHFLAARRLIDFKGPLGWDYSAVNLGRAKALGTGPVSGVETLAREVRPLVELRTPFSLSVAELYDADRGADDLDLQAVIDAARITALAEDTAIFHGYAAAGIDGIAASSPHRPVEISNDYSKYPTHVAKAVAILQAASIAGPYAIALGARCYTGVTESTEHGGYPVFEHLHRILGGPVVWAPAVDGAVVLSQRGDDYVMTVGEDLSIGYRGHDSTSVQLYIEESLTLQINTPEAAVHLIYR